MAAELLIRPLEPGDDRAGFSCGEAELDRFFHHYAGQNQFKLHVSVTYVALIGTRIVGFATVTPATLERAQLPRSRKKLPAYPLPVLRLARLAVDLAAQGGGVGAQLLAFVLRLARSQRDKLGCVGVLTDAKPAAVPFYERYGFLPLSETAVVEGMMPGEPRSLFLAVDSIP